MKILWILAMAVTAFAQQQDILVHRLGPAQGTAVFTAAAAPVKGAPYAAEAVTETVQRLADGTRITNQTTMKMYRDSEGRTRTDATVTPLGPWVEQGREAGVEMTTIHDPVKGETHTLHHETKSATRSGSRHLVRRDIRGQVEEQTSSQRSQHVRKEVEKRVVITGPEEAAAGDALMPGPAVMHWVRESPAGHGPMMIREKADVRTKQLGKRVMEGVECEGTLTTLTIPEGQIGNDRPIEVVTETWRSPDLKIDVLRKHVDPRFGETNYRLVNLVRAEQPRSLFEVPAGYDMKSAPATFNIQMDRKPE